MIRFDLLNPAKALRTEQDAMGAARAGAVGLYLSAALSAWVAVWIWLNRIEFMASARGAIEARGMKPSVAAHADSIVAFGAFYFPVGLAIVLALVCVVLGWIQWRRRTGMIPLIVLLFLVYSELRSLYARLTLPEQPAISTSTFEIVIGWLSTIVIVLLLWNGFRGGRRLRQLRLDKV